MLPYAVEAENRDSPASVDPVTEEPGHRIRHPRRSTAAAESIAVRDREERRLPVFRLVPHFGVSVVFVGFVGPWNE
jgi:hypothetical protein